MKTAAVLGCGKRSHVKEGWAIGHSHGEAWLKADPAIRLIAVDPSVDNLSAFGERFKLPKENLFPSTDAMYAAIKPDFVSVCTWPALHSPQVLEACSRGAKGIVCEKPMALDAREIRQMLSACKNAGTRLAIAHQRCYQPVFQLARKLLREGAIGTGLVLEGRVSDDWDILSWSVHWFDMARFLLDAMPKSVLAGMDFQGERRYGHAVEHASTIFVEYTNGAQAIFITGPASPEGFSVVVRGSMGLMRIGGKSVKIYSESGFSEIAPHAGEIADFQGDFTSLMREMISAVESNGSILCDAVQCASSTELAFAAGESARMMRQISLPMQTQFAPLEVAFHRPRAVMPAGKVILLADEHFGSGGREGITEAFAELTGHPPTVLDAACGLAPEDLKGAGLLALYHTQKTASESTQKLMQSWVHAGKPLLLIHAAVGAWPEWAEYQRWCGRVWIWGPGGSAHPHEPSTLQMLNPTPGQPWAEAWLPNDEVFIKLGERAECIDLVSASIPQGVFPAAWRSKTFPSIGVWIPGHRGDLWRVPAMRSGLLDVIRQICESKR